MNKIFLWATWSIASIKLFDLYKSIKQQNIDVIWSTTNATKAYILSILKNQIEKNKDEINNKDTYNLNKKVTKLLETCVKQWWIWIDINEHFKIWKETFTQVNPELIDFLNDYEDGIDYKWTTSKEKWNVKHINIATEVDCALIWPCTANTLSKIVSWVTDNFILEVIRALWKPKPVYLAIAMNTNMLEDPFIQKNISDIDLYWWGKYIIIPTKNWLLQCWVEWNWAMADIETITKTIIS